MSKLTDYLNAYGILACNVNPYLPCLDDIGCSWVDVTDAIDRQELFCCKAYRKRTTYLSREAYRLLRHCRPAKKPEPQAQRILDLLQGNPPIEINELRAMSGIPGKEFQKAFSSLLEDLLVTALQNGTVRNANWSTFRYGTAAAWEAAAEIDLSPCGSAKEKLWDLLSATMDKKEFQRLLR